MKRPVSVWLVQFVLGGFLLVFVAGSGIWLTNAVPGLAGAESREIVFFLAELALRSGILVFLVLASVRIARRQSPGRWHGLMGLSIVLVVWAAAHLIPRRGDLARYAYDNSAQEGGALIANALLFIGFCVLFYAFGFSRRSRDFFDATTGGTRGTLPAAPHT